MARFDLPLEELRAYRPQVAEPRDFDDFWARTISEARVADWAPRIERVESVLTSVEVNDVEFAGFAGDPIRAWYLLPSNFGRPTAHGGRVQRLRRRSRASARATRVAGAQQPGQDLLPLKLFPAAVFFHYHVGDFVDALVGGEALFTLQAFAPAANRFAFLALTRVHYFVIFEPAKRTFHRVLTETLNGV